MNVHAVAADALLTLHALFALFVVAGLCLVIAGGAAGWAWVRNPWFRLAHLAAVAVVVLQSWASRVCPLTTWEVALRQRAGQSAYEGSFIAHWLQQLLYYEAPEWVFMIVYTGFGALVLASWWWVKPRPLRRH